MTQLTSKRDYMTYKNKHNIEVFVEELGDPNTLAFRVVSIQLPNSKIFKGTVTRPTLLLRSQRGIMIEWCASGKICILLAFLCKRYGSSISKVLASLY